MAQSPRRGPQHLRQSDYAHTSTMACTGLMSTSRATPGGSEARASSSDANWLDASDSGQYPDKTRHRRTTKRSGYS